MNAVVQDRDNEIFHSFRNQRKMSKNRGRGVFDDFSETSRVQILCKVAKRPTCLRSALSFWNASLSPVHNCLGGQKESPEVFVSGFEGAWKIFKSNAISRELTVNSPDTFQYTYFFFRLSPFFLILFESDVHQASRKGKSPSSRRP